MTNVVYCTSPSSRSLPAGIVHEGGDNYLVPFEILQVMAMPSDDDKSTQCKPVNLRHLGRRTNNPMSSKGFKPEEMNELQQSVIDEGWFGSFLCRWVKTPDGKVVVQLVAGERRYRTITILRERNLSVRDRSKDKRSPSGELLEAGQSPATDVYKCLKCEIKVMDDEEAVTFNHIENDKHVAVGERANLRAVARMRQWGWDDEKILNKLKKSGQWLRESDTLLELDEDTLQAVCDERVNRTGALILVKIDDPAERHNVLVDATENAWNRAKVVIEKREGEKTAAENQEELAELRLADAQHRDDTKRIRDARINYQEAHAAADHSRLNLDQARRSAQVQQKDVRTAIRNVRPRSNRNANVTALRPAKIRKYYSEPIKKMLGSEGKNEAGDVVALTSDLHLLDLILDDILFGRTTALEGRLKSRLLSMNKAS